jgi:hypothetical protein
VSTLYISDDLREVPGEGEHIGMLLLRELGVDSHALVCNFDLSWSVWCLLGYLNGLSIEVPAERDSSWKNTAREGC